MDSCSVSQQHLGQNSPTNKHLYRAEVASYKQQVSNFYKDVSKLPKVKSEELAGYYSSENGTVSHINPALELILKYAVDIRSDLLVSSSVCIYITCLFPETTLNANSRHRSSSMDNAICPMTLHAFLTTTRPTSGTLQQLKLVTMMGMHEYTICHRF